MNFDNDDEFYNLVKMIVNDNQTRKIIYGMDEQEIQNLAIYLDNNIYFEMVGLIDRISKKLEPHGRLENDNRKLIGKDNVINSIIEYYTICFKKNLSMLDILLMCKYVLMKAGANKINISQDAKNIIMKKITLTLESILHRDFDKEIIDENLKEGAIQRKMYLQRKVKTTLVPRRNISSSSESIIIRTDPQTKHKIEPEIITIENYNDPKIIKPIKIKTNPLKKPISHDLDIPPITVPHASLIANIKKTTPYTSVITSEAKTTEAKTTEAPGNETKVIVI